MNPAFGCGAHDYAFDTMDYTTLSMVEREVRDILYSIFRFGLFLEE